MVFKAEAIGLVLALHMLKFEHEVWKATIWLDNQAVLGALMIHKPQAAQGIIDEILVQIDNIWRRARHPAFQLEISWVKGHSGVEGNEKVDQEVKDAAKGYKSGAPSPILSDQRKATREYVSHAAGF